MICNAIIDLTGKYRYTLTRIWDKSRGKVVFILLNPSTADAIEDDPTLKKCIGFAKRWGYGSLEVVNLFAYRATEPEDLKQADDPIGIENDLYIKKAVNNTDLIILGWGNNCEMWGRYHHFSQRHKQVLNLIIDFKSYYLVITKEGHPKHPLYVGYDIRPTIFSRN